MKVNSPSPILTFTWGGFNEESEVEYVLILMVHVGLMGDGNSNALTTAIFSSKKNCEQAGEEAAKMSINTTLRIKFICAKK